MNMVKEFVHLKSSLVSHVAVESKVKNPQYCIVSPRLHPVVVNEKAFICLSILNQGIYDTVSYIIHTKRPLFYTPLHM